jgi:hypothetical protein
VVLHQWLRACDACFAANGELPAADTGSGIALAAEEGEGGVPGSALALTALAYGMGGWLAVPQVKPEQSPTRRYGFGFSNN